MSGADARFAAFALMGVCKAFRRALVKGGASSVYLMFLMFDEKKSQD
jgi:hypothetical protein